MQGMGSEQGFWTLLSEDERAALSDLGMRKDYPVGAPLCLEGDPNTHVFILLHGWVRIFGDRFAVAAGVALLAPLLPGVLGSSRAAVQHV